MDIWFDDLKEETKQAIKDYYNVNTDEELFMITGWDTEAIAYADLPLDNTHTQML
jgi:hypothetical protein